MGSITALLTGLTGLNANSKNLEVIGNNIANVNTTAYKNSRLLFSTAMQRTMGDGSKPESDTGGTNPRQIGLGVNVAGSQHDFSQGSLQTTGDGRDLAIEGNGFFVVQRGVDTLYTRAGSFRQNAEGNLVTIDGDLVMGNAVDDKYVLKDGTLGKLNIPLGTRAVAEATTNVLVVGNVNAAGDLSAGGSRVLLNATSTLGFQVLRSAANQPDSGHKLETSSLLVDIEDPKNPDLPMFASGQKLEIKGARKGGAAVPTADLVIASDTTVQNMLDFFNEALGLHKTGGANPDGRTPGAGLNETSGTVTIDGNIGTINDLGIASSDIRLVNADGSTNRLPFVFTKEQDATGESVRTTFITYDSLGQEIAVDITMAIENKTDAGTGWRYFLESAQDSDLDLRLSTGTLSFDTSGLLISNKPVTASVDRANTGAASPLTFTVDFSKGGAQLTSLADDPSSIASTFRNGRPSGTLEDFNISKEGLISGVFSNGLSRTLGRVMLANFVNKEGLIEEGANLFREGPNSGAAAVVSPGSFGTGGIVSGALEQANVDLGKEFVNMITASTGYSASSRIVSTANQLLQQLMVLGR